MELREKITEAIREAIRRREKEVVIQEKPPVVIFLKYFDDETATAELWSPRIFDKYDVAERAEKFKTWFVPVEELPDEIVKLIANYEEQ